MNLALDTPTYIDNAPVTASGGPGWNTLAV
jgi:hypothetical protein